MKTIINRMKRLNEALPMLVMSIIGYGFLIELIGVWFMKDKLRYSTGLLIGICCAVFMAVHIAKVIEAAVHMGEGHEKKLSVMAVFRYVIVVIVFFAMVYFDLGNMWSALAGIFGLKVCAYAQPMLYKIFNKPQRGEETTEEEVKT